MLFTSAGFAFLYLPVVFAGFFLIGRRSEWLAAAWLLLASLLFYAHWQPAHTLLLVGSIVWNFLVGRQIGTSSARSAAAASATNSSPRRWLALGVAVNLLLLGYFKYANFLIDNLNLLLGSAIDIGRIELPIGISFFTFTQIAFLADTYQKGLREYRPVHYGLFVTYFPHLVAGPVLHHAQMMPQFSLADTYRPRFAHIASGMAIFCIGLFKKVVIADGIAPYADSVFNATAQGQIPTMAEAWLATLAYTAQLYFDFSGYSDMAIGLSRLFNIRLPYNFNSPYQCGSIIDFWRCWHISLSNFLRDYLYIALGGNRRGAFIRYRNLMITMVLGGLWHGASWNFVIWGTLHGAYLLVNHGWRALLGSAHARLASGLPYRIAAWSCTLLTVMIGWVWFRATDFGSALTMMNAMFGILSATPSPADAILWNQGLDLLIGFSLSALALAATVVLPNSNHLGERLIAYADKHESARAVMLGAAIMFAALLVGLNASRNAVSAFIYFNF